MSGAVPQGDDDAFVGVQVVRDSMVGDDEVAIPLLEFRCCEQLSDVGEFVPFGSSELVRCLRRDVSTGLLFACDRGVAGCSSSVAAAGTWYPSGGGSADCAPRSPSPRDFLGAPPGGRESPQRCWRLASAPAGPEPAPPRGVVPPSTALGLRLRSPHCASLGHGPAGTAPTGAGAPAATAQPSMPRAAPQSPPIGHRVLAGRATSPREHVTSWRSPSPGCGGARPSGGHAGAFISPGRRSPRPSAASPGLGAAPAVRGSSSHCDLHAVGGAVGSGAWPLGAAPRPCAPGGRAQVRRPLGGAQSGGRPRNASPGCASPPSPLLGCPRGVGSGAAAAVVAACRVAAPGGPAAPHASSSCSSPRLSPPLLAMGASRGQSPKGCSPKSSLSPEGSRSPRGVPQPLRAPGASRCFRRSSSPRAASPFNPLTDFDVVFELPGDVEWHRFEAHVGVADWAAETWTPGAHARFLLIDDDWQALLWESSDCLEPWAPPELCSVRLPGAPDGGAEAERARRLRLRVSSLAPPDGALWMDPALTMPRAAAAALHRGPARPEEGEEVERRRGAAQPWGEIFLGELAVEIACCLQCRDAARLMETGFLDGHLQQLLWHFVFAHNFRAAYGRYFVRPLQGQPRPAALHAPPQARAGHPVPAGHRSPRCGAVYARVAHGGVAADGEAHAASAAPAHPVAGAHLGGLRGPSRPLAPLRPGGAAGSRSPPPGAPRGSLGAATAAHGVPALSVVALVASARVVSAAAARGALLCAPDWAIEVFDWRQICRRFFLSQLLSVSVNFQLLNCTTPVGFLKDSGETLHAPKGAHGQTLGAPRCGWNTPLGAEHFLSRPSAVVAHRSPLGVAGMPPNVATVRGTAGPEPLAMTPMVSEKDSSVVLPQASSNAHVRPQWTLEVDPGRYLVVATVGDRNVSFAANLEVGGQPVFAGDWIDAGSFRSRCVLCVTLRGAITVSPHWPPRHGGAAARAASPLGYGLLAPPGCGHRGEEAGFCESEGAAVRHESPPSPSPRGGRGASPRPSRVEALARGTRLVSLRVVSALLAREVLRERPWTLSDVNHKLAEAKARVEELLDARARRNAAHPPPDGETRRPSIGGDAALERELARAQGKHAELQAQKALKLCSMTAMAKRVTHPYIYLNGDASAVPPAGHLPPMGPSDFDRGGHVAA